MKPLRIADAETMVLGLQDEIRRSEESRYHHRLHGVLLVAQGLSCPRVAELLGDAPRTVEYWVGRFERRGLAGLAEGARSGRPARLDQGQMSAVAKALRQSPRQSGIEANLWDGKTLSAFIAKRLGVQLRVRQCQRLFRRLDFRLRKPRPVIAPNDPIKRQRHEEKRAAHKKTAGAGRR